MTEQPEFQDDAKEEAVRMEEPEHLCVTTSASSTGEFSILSDGTVKSKFVSVSLTPEARDVLRAWAKELQRETGETVSLSETVMEVAHRGEVTRAELERLRASESTREMSESLAELVHEEFSPDEGWTEFRFSDNTTVHLQDGFMLSVWQYDMTAVRASKWHGDIREDRYAVFYPKGHRVIRTQEDLKFNRK